jgi:hypothetical protein
MLNLFRRISIRPWKPFLRGVLASVRLTAEWLGVAFCRALDLSRWHEKVFGGGFLHELQVGMTWSTDC